MTDSAPLAGDGVDVESFSLTHYDRPWLSNDEWSGGSRGIGGRRGRTTLTRQWKDDFCRLALAERIPGLAWVEITVRQCCKDRRRPDLGACYPAVKAAIDGIVAAGVLPDDNDDYVRLLSFAPSLIVGYDALQLELSGPRCSPAEKRRRTIEAERQMRGRFVRRR
jgi:hypothetical protein